MRFSALKFENLSFLICQIQDLVWTDAKRAGFSYRFRAGAGAVVNTSNRGSNRKRCVWMRTVLELNGNERTFVNSYKAKSCAKRKARAICKGPCP